MTTTTKTYEIVKKALEDAGIDYCTTGIVGDVEEIFYTLIFFLI